MQLVLLSKVKWPQTCVTAEPRVCIHTLVKQIFFQGCVQCKLWVQVSCPQGRVKRYILSPKCLIRLGCLEQRRAVSIATFPAAVSYFSRTIKHSKQPNLVQTTWLNTPLPLKELTEYWLTTTACTTQYYSTYTAIIHHKMESVYIIRSYLLHLWLVHWGTVTSQHTGPPKAAPLLRTHCTILSWCGGLE